VRGHNNDDDWWKPGFVSELVVYLVLLPDCFGWLMCLIRFLVLNYQGGSQSAVGTGETTASALHIVERFEFDW
jgi:hypothetical protein